MLHVFQQFRGGCSRCHRPCRRYARA
jgi:hypothetical protein